MNNCSYWTSERFFERLEFFLASRHWSMQRLAQEADVSISSLYMMRTRRTLPSFFTLCAICDALDITVSKFLNYEPDSPNRLFIVHSLSKLPESTVEVIAALIELLR